MIHFGILEISWTVFFNKNNTYIGGRKASFFFYINDNLLM